MKRLMRELVRVAESGWGATARVLLLFAAMAVAALAFSFAGLFRFV
jgi:hypothetical protein